MMVSYQYVGIVKIPGSSKVMAFSIKCPIVLFSWESNLIVLEYEIPHNLPDSDVTI